MTHRIELGEIHHSWKGLWADIRIRNFAGQARVDAAAAPRRSLSVSPEDVRVLRSKIDEGEGAKDITELLGHDVEIPIIGGDPIETTVAIIESSVVAWSLVDAEGEPLPLGRAGVTHEDLRPQVMAQLVDAIEDYERSQQIPEAELKTSAPA